MGNVGVDGQTGSPQIARIGLTFAMVELADPRDCNDRRRLWKKNRMADITPEVAMLRQVPSLNKKLAIKYAKTIIGNMASIDADWFLLSGHHGRLYATDDRFFGSDDAFSSFKYYNTLDYVGFFNNDYHHHTWEDVMRSTTAGSGKPMKLAVADRKNKKWNVVAADSISLGESEIFLSTTGTIPAEAAPFNHENPILVGANDSTRAARCKGLILSACNTLAFKSVRTSWHSKYPDSFFFGTFRTIGHGWWVTNAIRRAAMTNKAFWTNPSFAVPDEDAVKELTAQVAAGFPSARRDFGLGTMFKGRVYLPRFESGKLRIEVFDHDADLPYSGAQ